MNRLLRLLVLLFVAILLWLWMQRRKSPRKIEASNAAIEVGPTNVILPEESEPEDRAGRQRTGETQELSRKVIHGPYHPIDDRGEPSAVGIGRES